MLIPLKFTPLFKEKIWGGNSLFNKYNKLSPESITVGESWELSGLLDDETIVETSAFEGNEINELVEVYMEEILGEQPYRKYGNEFPLMVKFIDTAENSSVHVHPDDQIAAERHHSYGKTKFWWIADCEEGAKVYLGFKKKLSKGEYLKRVIEGTITEVMNVVEVKKGDSFSVPAGVVNCLGGGIVALEIGQSSDINYRIFDWNRDGDRELHNEFAEDAVDFDYTLTDCLATRKGIANESVELFSDDHFTTNLLEVEASVVKDYSDTDSFVILTVTEGEITLDCGGSLDAVMCGETILIPACVDEAKIIGTATIIETYL